MQQQPAFVSREIDSPFIYRAWEARFTSDGELHVAADGTWDIVFSRLHDKVTCSITGPNTRPVTYSYYAGQWALGLQFREGVYLPGFPAREVINTIRPVQGGNGMVQIKGHDFDIPRLDEVEEFVDSLYRHGLLARDVVVEQTLQKGTASAPMRSVQRHFTNTTGIPLSRHKQIQRAQEAARLLRSGTTITEVTHICGYYDQAHLTRSLKQLLGKTPQQLRNLPE